MNVMPIEDMRRTYLEHSMVIHNFVIKVGNQIKDSLCRVFGDSVQYQWRENDDKIVIPDVSIICNMRDRKNVSFTGIPRFVMEVLEHMGLPLLNDDILSFTEKFITDISEKGGNEL